MARFKKCNWKSRRIDRRKYAEELTEKRAKLTDEQQLVALTWRPGDSLQETLRLQKAIKERNHAPQTRKAKARRHKKKERQE